MEQIYGLGELNDYEKAGLKVGSSCSLSPHMQLPWLFAVARHACLRLQCLHACVRACVHASWVLKVPRGLSLAAGAC